MDLLTAFVLLILLAGAAGIAVFLTRHFAPTESDRAVDASVVAREAGIAAAEQSGAVMSQLLDANRALMETERERSSSELDGKRLLIDARLESMNEELHRVTDLLK